MAEHLITVPGLTLTRPGIADTDEFLELVDASRRRHDGLVEPPSSRASFRAYVRRVRHPNHDGFLVRTESDAVVVGVVNINAITRGSLQSASLGYYRLSGAGGREAMPRALTAVVSHAFGRLGLHRLEANIQPLNRPSIALVSGLGFTREGFSPGYMRVGGAWRDHERWAIVSGDWRHRGEDRPDEES